MSEKNNSALFFLCSLIEYIGRDRHLERKQVVEQLGREAIEHIYDYADVLHCEPIAKAAYEFISEFAITQERTTSLKLLWRSILLGLMNICRTIIQTFIIRQEIILRHVTEKKILYRV